MSQRVTFLFLFVLYGISFGQIDPAAKPFLSGAAPVEPQVPVRALDYTLCFTSYGEADRTETCVRTAADFVRQRMLIET